MLIDTHCHLMDPAFDGDRDAVLARARAAGVGHVVAIGETPERADTARELARRDPAVSATAGLHPHEARSWSPELERWLEHAATAPEVVAVGETGLDYHYDFSPRPRQQEAFAGQLAVARRTGRPAVVHAREADEDLEAILRNEPGAVAVLHSFSSGPGLLRAAIGLGHYVSWSGMITFRSWRDDALIRTVPLDRVLVETDAPYLAPVPHRGRRNEPAHVVQTARRLAEVLGLAPDEVAERTSANARRLFGARVHPSSQEMP
jgi:TatD DNase family protein